MGATLFKDLPLFIAYCDKEVLEKKVLHDHALKDTHLGLVERLDKVGSVSESFVQKFVLLLVLLVFQDVLKVRVSQDVLELGV